MLRDNNETFVPAVAGWGVVASGFALIMGASEGCGGGVARCKSSFRTYVPTKPCQSLCLSRLPRLSRPTFSNEQLVFGPGWIRQGIVCFDHRQCLTSSHSSTVCSLCLVSRRGRENTGIWLLSVEIPKQMDAKRSQLTTWPLRCGG